MMTRPLWDYPPSRVRVFQLCVSEKVPNQPPQREVMQQTETLWNMIHDPDVAAAGGSVVEIDVSAVAYIRGTGVGLPCGKWKDQRAEGKG